MRVRWSTLTVFAACIATMAVSASPAAAKIERITGGVRCTISSPVITFNPGLRNKHHIEGTQRGRGPSASSLTAALSGCTDPSAGPAPAGIDHGALQGTGRVSGSYCEHLGHLKLKSTINWMKADETIVGSTNVTLALSILRNFDDPWVVSFAGTARRSSHVFQLDPVSFSLTTSQSNFGISANCFKVSLDSLGFTDGTFAADPP